METFNLKRFSKKQDTQEEMLQHQRDEQKTELSPPAKNTEKMLAEKRKNADHKETQEALLKDVREGKVWNQTLEAQMDSHNVDKDLPRRDGKDKYSQLPINLLEEVRHQEKVKAYNAAQEAKEASDLSNGGKVDVADKAKSQLHNHSDRFDKLTEKGIRNDKVKEMITASLKDADAMLYYIYYKAAQENRELSTKEQELIDGITANKIEIASYICENNG